MTTALRIIRLAIAGLVFAATVFGHFVTQRMPFHEDIYGPLQRHLAHGTVLILMLALIGFGPALWRRWLAPVYHRYPLRSVVFLILSLWAMWLPARQNNLINDYPMMLLLFNKLAAGLWFALELSLALKQLKWEQLSHNLQTLARSKHAIWITAVIAGGSALAANWHLWDGLIRIPDEASYWIQGAMLAQGRLWLPAEPWSAAFISEFNVLDGDKWYGAYPPGWPVFLALGWLIGAPSFINPLLTAAIAALTMILVRRHFPAWTALPACLMIAFSPWLWEQGMTYLSHSATLFPLVLGLVFLSSWLKSPNPGRAMAAAVAFGWIILTRQLDAVCLFAALGLWAMFGLPAVAWRHRLILIGNLILSGLIFGGLHMAYNAALTGHPLYFPLKRYYDLLMGEQWFRYGFGPEIGDLSGYCYALGHSPLEGFWNAWVNVTVINGDFLGWPGGSLALFWVWLFWGRKGALGRLLLTLAAVLFGAYFFWWYHGLLTGSRYYFMLWILALWGSLGGLPTLGRMGHELFRRRGGPARSGGIRFVVASTLLALLCYYPLLWFGYYPGFFGIEREPWDKIEREVEKPALIFVAGGGYNQFAVPYCLNNVPPGGDVVWAKSLDAELNEQLMAAYPGRTIYLVEDLRISEYERPLDNP